MEMTMTSTRKKARLAKTRNGLVVELGRIDKVDGGWVGYVLREDGTAAEVFIPE